MPETVPANAMLEIRISCPPVLAAYLEELLWTVDGVESVTQGYAANPDTDETTLSDLSYVSVLTRNPQGEDWIKVMMVENPRLMKVTDIIATRWIAPEDWESNWKQYWHPTRISEALVIAPSWEDYQPQNPGERVIRLDPGCAFGTGTHETTRLMLLALEKLAAEKDFSQLSVLDVGTGSGILAIDAAMRGSRDVRGVDIDPAAIPSAEENARLNGVADVIHFSDTPLSELCLTRYDLVLANIIAPVILALLPEMLARLQPGGTLLLSGLIEKSVGAVESALREAGLTDIERTRQGDWYALAGLQPG